MSINHIYNGFPLFLVDSIGYLERANDLAESNHWSNTYMLFIYSIIKIFGSIHFIAISQNLFVALVLYFFCKYSLRSYTHYKYLGLSLLLVFSSLSWISTMVMSDIFTSISLLCIILILNKPLLKHELFITSTLLFIGFSSHQSHILTLPIYTITLAIIISIFGSQSRVDLLKKSLLVFALLFFSNQFEKNVLNLFQTNVKKEISASKNKGSNSKISSGYYFVAVRIAESGKLETLLNDFCDNSNKNYLCKETGKYDASRIKNTNHNSRNDNNRKYLKYSKDTKEFVLFSLKKIQTYIGISGLIVKRGFSLLTKTGIKNYQELEENRIKRLKKSIRAISRPEVKSFKKSKQIKKRYKKFSNWTYKNWTFLWWQVLFPISFLLFLFLIFKNIKNGYLTVDSLLIIVYLCYAHLLNVLICGTFSNNNNVRYSSRTLWLVNIAIVFIFFYLYTYLKTKDKATNT